MIEVTLALSAAVKAVGVIKKGLALGKEASELSSQFGEFFDNKDKITAARAEVENTTLGSKVFAKQSVESYALEVALAEHKTKELEKQLRELFVYSGQTEIYTSMMRIRAQERRRRSIQARRVAEQKKFAADMLLIAGMVVVTLGFIGALIMLVVKGQ
mgnify:FL=1|tara:strand:+ start:368 stop:841 length:474 start_codon:yes stop_codon:yes gene_type:complete